jgi:hypothetical protein
MWYSTRSCSCGLVDQSSWITEVSLNVGPSERLFREVGR